MAVTIQVPTALRNFTERQAEVKVEGGTVGEAIAALAVLHPALKTHLFQDDGGLRSFINVFVPSSAAGGDPDTNIKKLQGLETPLADGAVIMLVPAIAGGTGGTGGSPLEFAPATLRCTTLRSYAQTPGITGRGSDV
jgi:adenylyltransferase/sulfurtransferase